MGKTQKLNIKGNHLLTIFGLCFLLFFSIQEYLYHEIPFNTDPFMFWPADSFYTFRAITIILLGLVFGVFLLIRNHPLFFIPYLIVLAISLKPVIIGIPQKQEATSFFEENRKSMQQWIDKQQNNNNNHLHSGLEGFEQCQAKEDYYFFIVHSLLDSGYGFVYVKDTIKTAADVMGLRPYEEQLDDQWYYVTY